MSINPEASQIYTPCCWDHLCNSSISVHPHWRPPATLNGSGGWVLDFPATMASKCSSTSSQLVSPGGPLTTLKDHMYIIRLRYWYMPYSNPVNLVTVARMNMTDEMPCAYGILRTTAVTIRHQVSCCTVQWSHLLSKSPADLRRGPSSFNIWLFYKSNLVAY